MRHVYLVTLFVCVLIVSILGFRGTTFTAPPMDVFPGVGLPRHEVPAEAAPAGGEQVLRRRSRRPHAAGRAPCARGMLRDDDHLYRRQGRRRRVGSAGSPPRMTVDLQVPRARPRSLHDLLRALPRRDRRRQRHHEAIRHGHHADLSRCRVCASMAEGEIYNTITNGKNTTCCPTPTNSSPEDRWAVVAYVRALQRAQQGTAADVTDAAAQIELSASNELPRCHRSRGSARPNPRPRPRRARRSSSASSASRSPPSALLLSPDARPSRCPISSASPTGPRSRSAC